MGFDPDFHWSNGPVGTDGFVCPGAGLTSVAGQLRSPLMNEIVVRDLPEAEGYENGFAEGTMVETEAGAVPVEDLVEGMCLRTNNHGFRPVLWLGTRRCIGRSDMTPVVIRHGALGNDRTIRVAPRHRLLVQEGPLAERAGGPVLVPAEQLVNGIDIHRARCGTDTTYHHILLDRHGLIRAEGLVTETMIPSPEGMDFLSNRQRAEIARLNPDIWAVQPIAPAPDHQRMRA